MKHMSPDDIERSAEAIPSGVMTRAERLERWANMLEQHVGPILALNGIEYLRCKERREHKGNHAPMTIAFADPILRDQGLSGDTLGEAMDFFGLSKQAVHELFCDCHHRGTMTGSGLAESLREIARPPETIGLWQRLMSIFGSRLAVSV